MTKTLDFSKLEAFADDKLNMAKIMKRLLNWVENIVGKGENAGDQYFLFSHNVFSKAFYFWVVKVRIVW